MILSFAGNLRKGSIFYFILLCNGICSSNSNMVDVIRMQMEVQRRLHEQLEVKTWSLKIFTIDI